MIIKPNLSFDELRELWTLAHNDGTLALTFADGKPSWHNFKVVKLFSDYFCGVYEDDGTPCGFFYLTDEDFTLDSIDIHFNILRAKFRDCVNIGTEVLHWTFEHTKHDVIFGTIPAIYDGTCQYAKRMGFIDIGFVHKLRYIYRLQRDMGCKLYMLTKEDFNNGKHIGRE